MTPRAAPAENSDTDDAARFTLDVSVNTDEDTDDAAARSTPDANRTEAAMRSFVQLKSAASSVILPSIWGGGGVRRRAKRAQRRRDNAATAAAAVHLVLLGVASHLDSLQLP